MQTNVFTLTSTSTFVTIDASALEAASPLLNRGTGCGRSVKERRQPLSFYLGREAHKLGPFVIWKDFKNLKKGVGGPSAYLQTSVREEHLQLPWRLVSRDTSHTHYPVRRRENKFSLLHDF